MPRREALKLGPNRLGENLTGRAAARFYRLKALESLLPSEREALELTYAKRQAKIHAILDIKPRRKRKSRTALSNEQLLKERDRNADPLRAEYIREHARKASKERTKRKRELQAFAGAFLGTKGIERPEPRSEVRTRHARILEAIGMAFLPTSEVQRKRKAFYASMRAAGWLP